MPPIRKVWPSKTAGGNGSTAGEPYSSPYRAFGRLGTRQGHRCSSLPSLVLSDIGYSTPTGHKLVQKKTSSSSKVRIMGLSLSSQTRTGFPTALTYSVLSQTLPRDPRVHISQRYSPPVKYTITHCSSDTFEQPTFVNAALSHGTSKGFLTVSHIVASPTSRTCIAIK